MRYNTRKDNAKTINQILSRLTVEELKALMQFLDEEPYPHQIVCEWAEVNIEDAAKKFDWIGFEPK